MRKEYFIIIGGILLLLAAFVIGYMSKKPVIIKETISNEQFNHERDSLFYIIKGLEKQVAMNGLHIQSLELQKKILRDENNTLTKSDLRQWIDSYMPDSN